MTPSPTPSPPTYSRGRSHSTAPISASSRPLYASRSSFTSSSASTSTSTTTSLASAPSPGSPSGPGYRSPPSYARSSLDRSPSLHPTMDERRVPPPIYLRSSSPQGVSSKGQLKIHIPAWGVVIVRPPRQQELHPLEAGGRQPPSEDTVLTGALEVIMKERRRCQAISVGVQSVSRLHNGGIGWEEDGVFERGVEVLGGDAEGIWLEKGSQSFTFALLLPATLAPHDEHTFGRISYILTARVEGIPAQSTLISVFKKDRTASVTTATDIPFKEDFDKVIARSDKVVQDNALQRSDSRRSSFGGNARGLSPQLQTLSLGSSPPDDSALAIGEGSPTVTGLYHRSQSTEIQRIPSLNLGGTGSPLADDNRSIHSIKSTTTVGAEHRTEKTGWLGGDLCASRGLVVHANPSPSGGVTQLEIRKEGFVEGLGTWRFSATSDVFCISAVILISLGMPNPAPACTIFFSRLLLVQNYSIVSPRKPNDPPRFPEKPRHHVLYQVGRPHKQGERFPGRNLDCLWRGPDAGGPAATGGEEEGWKARAVARLPNHDKVRPSTHDGTITPIRVTHEFVFQVFYSIEGKTVGGAPIDGPGELRMMAVKMPVLVPSCVCTSNALDLPTYETADSETTPDIDAIISSAPSSKRCMCGSTFAELGEAAMKKMRMAEQDEMEERLRDRAGSGSGSGSGSGEKMEMERRASGSFER